MNDIEHDPTPEPGPSGDRSGYGWIIAIELALLVFVGLGVAALIRGASGTDLNDALRSPTAVTVSLAALPTEIADMYHYVADHAEQFTQIPCYCGCDSSLGHRNLEDCFVTADGRWDAHASGCAVCTTEAANARELIAVGADASVVRQAIVDRYGPPPAAQLRATP